MIVVDKIDEVYMKVTADHSLRQELSDFFSFRPPNYQFNPKYKNRIWDGYIRMFNPLRPVLYIGLLDMLKKFCVDREYDIKISKQLLPITPDIKPSYVLDLAKRLNVPLEPRSYQIDYIVNALSNDRSLSLSPTSSGKSFIIYLIQQHYAIEYQLKTLIIVPTVTLVNQLAQDFIDYGCDESDIHKIQAGKEKNTDRPIVISTWQSLVKQDKEWFDQFGVVLGDEAHTFQAKSLTAIMENLTEARYKHGFTGTISSDSKAHKMVLEGVFGPVCHFVTTKQLIDDGTVADFKIKGLILSYNEPTKKAFTAGLRELKKKNPLKKNASYIAEREFIFSNEKRNNFIRNLVWSLKSQNNLILFDQVEKHGKILEPLLRKEGRILHFIYGDTSGDERERIRQQVENDNIETVNIQIGNYNISIDADSMVELSDGTTIVARNLTIDHDVSQKWIDAHTGEYDETNKG